MVRFWATILFDLGFFKRPESTLSKGQLRLGLGSTVASARCVKDMAGCVPIVKEKLPVIPNLQSAGLGKYHPKTEDILSLRRRQHTEEGPIHVVYLFLESVRSAG